MSSPCVLVLSRPGQRVFFRLSGANIKYLLYFCKMSLNGSFFKGGWGGGREQVLQCGSDAVTHITCSTRLFWSSSFLVLFRVFCFCFFLPRVRCAGHGVRQGV